MFKLKINLKLMFAFKLICKLNFKLNFMFKLNINLKLMLYDTNFSNFVIPLRKPKFLV